MRKTLVFVFLLVVIVSASGCAAGDARFEQTAAGFWAGLWHGMICLVTFVISLFNDNVRVYETYNSGHLYDLGFVLGAAIAFGGCGGSGSCRRRKSPKRKDWDNLSVRIEEQVKRALCDSAKK